MIDLKKYKVLDKLFNLDELKKDILKKIEEYKIGFCDVILDKNLSDEQSFYVSTIISSAAGQYIYNEFYTMYYDNEYTGDLDELIYITDEIINNINDELSNLIDDNVFSVAIDQTDGISIHLYVKDDGQYNLLNYLIENYDEISNISIEENHDGKNFLLVHSWSELEFFKTNLNMDYDDLFIGYLFSDECTTCSECYKLIHLYPGSAYDVKDWYCGDGFIWCNKCIKNGIDEIIRFYNDNPENAITYKMLSVQNLNNHGYYKYNDNEYDNGLYSHNNQDSPKKIAQELYKKGIYDFIFYINKNTNCFETTFDLYVKKDNNDGDDNK